MVIFLLIAGLIGCIAAAAVLATAEVALIRVRRAEVVVGAERGDQRSIALLGLLDDLPATLNSVLLVVLLCQVVAATISGVLAAHWFGGIGVTAATVVLTAFLFLYGEAVPKTLAVRSPLDHAQRLTRLLMLITVGFRPVVSGLLRLADLQATGEADLGALTEDQLRSLAKESAAVGEIPHEDVVMVERSFEFGDQRVRDIMVPRDEIEAVSVGESATEAFTKAVGSGHRRLPVIEEGVDHVVGIVRLRDVAAALTATAPVTVAELMTPALWCDPDQAIASVLRDMQSAGEWLAIAADGHRTVGLVTVEDIVSELVGEIADERAVKPTPRRHR